MAYAQAQADVELGALLVEQLRLGDGVAHHLIGARAYPVLRRYSGTVLGDGAGLADHRGDLEAVLS